MLREYSELKIDKEYIEKKGEGKVDINFINFYRGFFMEVLKKIPMMNKKIAIELDVE